MTRRSSLTLLVTAGVECPAALDAELAASLDLEWPGLQAVKAASVSGNPARMQEAYLHYRRTASRVRWEVMPQEMPWSPVSSSDVAGDELCRHFIRNYYNFEPRSADMGADFNWTFNPVSRSEPAFTDEWTYCAISRTQFWKRLVDAYWRTHDEKYAREWVAQLQDFASKNPMRGAGRSGKVSLWRTLDASERMFDSWPCAYFHCLNSSSFDARAQWVYLAMMRDHAELLMRGLSHPERTGNWVASECFGLYTIATLFPEFRDAATWSRTALDRIRTELDRAVPPDGFEAELTPNYHMVALRGYPGPLKLARLNGDPGPGDIRARLQSMYRALVTVMDQSGNVVATNDSPPLNAVRAASAGLELGNDSLLEWATSGGTRGTGLANSTALPYAGFYTMRGGWDRDDVFLFFRAGPAGVGHEHEDMLQIVLRAWNRTLLVEPGSYHYDSSEWRRYAIGTAAHTTVVVDGKWQHRGASSVPVARPMNNPWITTPLFDFVAGTYDGGYQQNIYNPRKHYQPHDWIGEPDRSVRHTRRILFVRPTTVLVLDSLDGSGEHTFDAHFHLGAADAAVDERTQSVTTRDQDDVRLALHPLDRRDLEVEIIKGQKDPLLGWLPIAHRPIPMVRFRKRRQAPALFATLLCPFRGVEPAVSAHTGDRVADGIWRGSLTIADEQTEIAIVLDGAPKTIAVKAPGGGDAHVHASGFIGRAALSGGWGMHSYRDPRVRFTLDVPADILIRSEGGRISLSNAGNRTVIASITHPSPATLTLTPGTWAASL